MSKGQTAGALDVPQLHVCPFCSQGYRRQASLKEHIMYRHETCDEDYTSDHSCSRCSLTFTYRSQLERHVSRHHQGSASPARKLTKTGANTRTSSGTRPGVKRSFQSFGQSYTAARRFTCNTCFKAFKFSHHLKEHLRIHSGEKPFECGNCKRRFTHSGTYSAHIASTKCSPFYFPNGLKQRPLSSRQAAARSAQLAGAQKQGKPLKEQIPLMQIKTEPPTGEDSEPVKVSPVKGVKRSRGKKGFLFQQPQKQIINLPAFVDNEGNTKIMINYIRSPESFPIIAALPISSRTDRLCSGEVQESLTDLSISNVVKEEPKYVPISDDLGFVISKTESVAEMPQNNKCSLCEEECSEHLEALHLLQHRKAANGEAVDSAALDPSFAGLLSEAGVAIPREPRHAAEDVLSALKSAFASNARQSDSELEEISESVGVPVEVVRKWFAKMNRRANRQKSEPRKEIPEKDKTVQEKTQDLEKQKRPVSPLILKLRKYINKRRLAIKSETQEKSERQETSKSQEISEFQEELSEFKVTSEFQDNLYSQADLELHSYPKVPEHFKVPERPRSQRTPVSKLGSKTNLKVLNKIDINLENLELHNYSKLSTNSELQEIPELQSISATVSVANKDPKELVKTDANVLSLEMHNYSKPSENSKLHEMTLSQTTSATASGSVKDLEAVVKTEPEDPDEPNSHAAQIVPSPSKLVSQEPTENTETPEKTTPLENVLVQQNVLQTVFQNSDSRLEYKSLSKEQLEPRAPYITTQKSNSTTSTQIPTLVAIAGQSTVGCLSAFNPTKKKTTILTPQLSYTYGAQASRSPR